MKPKELPVVMPARSSTTTVTLFLAPLPEVRNGQVSRTKPDAPTALGQFQVTAVGREQSMSAARDLAESRGYTIRASNWTKSGIVIYVASKTHATNK